MQKSGGVGTYGTDGIILAEKDEYLYRVSDIDSQRIKNRLRENGILETASGLRISYISQDTSFLHGTLDDFCAKYTLEESLFKAVLR